MTILEIQNKENMARSVNNAKNNKTTSSAGNSARDPPSKPSDTRRRKTEIKEFTFGSQDLHTKSELGRSEGVHNIGQGIDRVSNLGIRLGVIIRSARREQGLSQQVLAEKVGIGQSMLSRIESGANVARLNLSVLLALAETLNFSSVSNLFAAAEQPVGSLEEELFALEALLP